VLEDAASGEQGLNVGILRGAHSNQFVLYVQPGQIEALLGAGAGGAKAVVILDS
jgi:hypothetical protein